MEKKDYIGTDKKKHVSIYLDENEWQLVVSALGRYASHFEHGSDRYTKIENLYDWLRRTVKEKF
jgi:hypothetical protein